MAEYQVSHETECCDVWNPMPSRFTEDDGIGVVVGNMLQTRRSGKAKDPQDEDHLSRACHKSDALDTVPNRLSVGRRGIGG